MNKHRLNQAVLGFILLYVSFLLSACSNHESSIMEGSKPNIIFILADDMGWADLPEYGNKFNEAPSLSKMADEGIRFSNAYAASPVCSSSRQVSCPVNIRPELVSMIGYQAIGDPMKSWSYPKTGHSIYL